MVRSYNAIAITADLTADVTDIDPTVEQRDEGLEDFVTVTLAGSGSSPWFSTRDVQTVIVVATGTAKFYCGNEDLTIERELTFAGQVQTATATKAGFVCQDAMPPFLKVKDTSTSSNPMTIYFKRKNGSTQVID